MLELDALNDNPRSLPSLLYISRDGEHIVGRGAANAFIERNVDREVILKQVDLGIDIEGYVASEPDKEDGYRPPSEGEGVREAVRARAIIEVNSPGRLFQSIKSSLGNRSFKGTEVFGTHFQIEELVAHILQPIKAAVDAEAQEDVQTAVFGRPVRFSGDDDGGALAEERLQRAAYLAGFKQVAFFYEPVAACVEYAVATLKRQRLMVVDIGGGTCDVCIMEFGGAQDVAERLAESRILGVAGVPIAGDVLDREIMRAKIFPCLGSRTRYGPSNLPMPQFIYNNILDWQSMYKLNTEEIVNWLIAVEASCPSPEAIRALRTLIQRNYGYPLVRRVEYAKRRLSEEQEAPIELRHGDAMQIGVMINREEFGHIIEAALEYMLDSVKEAERAAGVQPDELDYVLTTGGTSLIPAVRHMLAERFGWERLIHRDTFTSVASGLAIVASHLA